MSGFVGYRKSNWDGATSEQRAVLKTVINALELGDPATGTIGGVDWYVFHDSRINPKFVENLAWFNTILASITTEPARVSQGDYTVAEGDDALTEAADAQGVVAWFAAASSLPASWVPDDPEE